MESSQLPALPTHRSPIWKENQLKAFVVLSALLITVGHFVVPMDLVILHNLLRRLYYLPIVVAAVGYGARGGLLAALGCTLLYLPHAFFMHHGHGGMHGMGGMEGMDHSMDHGGGTDVTLWGISLAGDPSPDTEKFVELVIFHGVGLLTGVLSERWVRALRQAEALTDKLEAALDERDRMRVQLVRTEKLGALGQLSAGLAHEIRNPLSSIRGSAEVLAEDFPAGTPKGRLATILLAELGRLDGVLTEFLQFARPPLPQAGPVPLDTILQDVDAMTATVRQQGGVTLLRTTVGPQAVVWADPAQVRQVLLNLVRNAMEAMEHGGTITLGTRPATLHGEPGFSVDVTDTGPGIPADILVKIFEPYFTTKDTGTGLGLSISHALADANGGLLDVTSPPGAGTTFTLTLPTRFQG
jgi:signal transduction histidine kinase